LKLRISTGSSRIRENSEGAAVVGPGEAPRILTNSATRNFKGRSQGAGTGCGSGCDGAGRAHCRGTRQDLCDVRGDFEKGTQP